jgi:hypothetical protein
MCRTSTGLDVVSSLMELKTRAREKMSNNISQFELYQFIANNLRDSTLYLLNERSDNKTEANS